MSVKRKGQLFLQKKATRGLLHQKNRFTVRRPLSDRNHVRTYVYFVSPAGGICLRGVTLDPRRTWRCRGWRRSTPPSSSASTYTHVNVTDKCNKEKERPVVILV